MDKTVEIRKQREKIVRGLELAYQKLVEFKKSKNSPIVISRGNEIIEIDPQKALPTTTYKWH